ncbi:hypothetical protein BJ742DRAFT_140819 [Cladochytrium replicatum]|nr:hypothetical protein BJ742DRAFT_140819 [Cladochytrium replicatum]
MNKFRLRGFEATILLAGPQTRNMLLARSLLVLALVLTIAYPKASLNVNAQITPSCRRQSSCAPSQCIRSDSIYLPVCDNILYERCFDLEGASCTNVSQYINPQQAELVCSWLVVNGSLADQCFKIYGTDVPRYAVFTGGSSSTSPSSTVPSSSATSAASSLSSTTAVPTGVATPTASVGNSGSANFPKFVVGIFSILAALLF